MPVNKAVIQQWVTDLRSGEFPQTKAALERRKPFKTFTGEVYPVGFCCLGVLCNQAAKEGLIDSGIIDEVEGRVSFDGAGGFLPRSVYEWAGLGDSSPIVHRDGNEYELSSLNDAYNITFNEIADLIEKEYLNG